MVIQKYANIVTNVADHPFRVNGKKLLTVRRQNIIVMQITVDQARITVFSLEFSV